MSDAPPVLRQVNIVAEDFDATLSFYRLLGFEIPGMPERDGIRHAEVTFSNGLSLELDNHALARTYNAAWRRPHGSSRTVIGFSLSSREEVDRRFAQLTAAGYEGRQAPYDAFWGARYAIVADPVGNDVGLMSPIDETRKAWPPTESP